MDFVWNEIQAEDIRSQSATAMQGTVDDMRDTAQGFTEEANALAAEAAALEAAPPIMKTITVTGRRRNSDGESEEYTRTEQVVDTAAMNARRAQIDALKRQAAEKTRLAGELSRAAEALNTAADILEGKIETTNELFRQLFGMQ